MTTREKIISLARECANPDTIDCYHNDYFTLDLDEMETFYHAVRNQALEDAAVKCDETREIEDHWDGGTTTVHKCFYRDDCIAAIRQMKEETK